MSSITFLFTVAVTQEKGMGNSEFLKAETALRQTVEAMHLPEADCFMEEFLPSYALTLDEQD